MSLPILLLGAGGHARACIDVIEAQARFAVSGLVGLPQECGTRVLGYPVLGTDADIPELLTGRAHALVSMGQIKTPEPRVRLFGLVKQYGSVPPAIVSAHAYVSRHAVVGAGTIVMHGAVVNAGAIVGENCILNSQSLIEHDVFIEDHCHISTGAAINSGVRVGAGSFVGSGASVRQGLRLGERCLVGLGQRVLKDLAAGTWIPARRGQQ